MAIKIDTTGSNRIVKDKEMYVRNEKNSNYYNSRSNLYFNNYWSISYEYNTP